MEFALLGLLCFHISNLNNLNNLLNLSEGFFDFV